MKLDPLEIIEHDLDRADVTEISAAVYERLSKKERKAAMVGLIPLEAIAGVEMFFTHQLREMADAAKRIYLGAFENWEEAKVESIRRCEEFVGSQARKLTLKCSQQLLQMAIDEFSKKGN